MGCQQQVSFFFVNFFRLYIVLWCCFVFFLSLCQLNKFILEKLTTPFLFFIFFFFSFFSLFLFFLFFFFLFSLQRYCGTGESVVFQIKPGAFKMYGWTGTNSYFMLSNPSMMAMGGGGDFAFRIDGSFKGTTGSSSTFGNLPLLNSGKPEFQVFDIEVFCLVPGTEIDLTRKAQDFQWNRTAM